jgi:hypothetical protein
MRTLARAAAGWFVVVLMSVPAAAQDVAPPSVVQAAGRALPAFLRGVQESRLPELGFPSRQAAETAVAGVAFQVHTIDPQRLLGADASVGVTDMAVATPQWQLLVMSGGEALATVTVAPIDGRWRGVAVGASGLASQLHDLVMRWPASQGYACRLVRVYQATSDIVGVWQAGRLRGVVPLASSRAALGLAPAFDPQDLHDGRELAAALRPLVSRGLRGSALRGGGR